MEINFILFYQLCIKILILLLLCDVILYGFDHRCNYITVKSRILRYNIYFIFISVFSKIENMSEFFDVNNQYFKIFNRVINSLILFLTRFLIIVKK